MSFGFGVGDFIAVAQLTRKIYRSCKGAPGEFQELSRELNTLHTILLDLEDEAQSPTSLLNRKGAGRKAEMDTLVGNLQGVLGEIEGIVSTYQSLGRDQKRTWDRAKFAAKENLTELRTTLTVHVTSLNLFTASLSASSLGRIEAILEELVRDIKLGKKEPTILSVHEEDELDWGEVERELVGEGFTKQVLEDHKEDIKAYLKALIGEERGGNESDDDSLIGEMEESQLSSRSSTPIPVAHSPAPDFTQTSNILALNRSENDTMDFNHSLNSEVPENLPRNWGYSTTKVAKWGGLGDNWKASDVIEGPAYSSSSTSSYEDVRRKSSPPTTTIATWDDDKLPGNSEGRKRDLHTGRQARPLIDWQRYRTGKPLPLHLANRSLILLSMDVMFDEGRYILIRNGETYLSGTFPTIRAGAAFSIKLDFMVQNKVLRGLRYEQEASRVKSRPKTFRHEEEMLGSHAPDSPPVTMSLQPQRAPSGVLAKGRYNVVSIIRDEAGETYSRFEWVLIIVYW